MKVVTALVEQDQQHFANASIGIAELSTDRLDRYPRCLVHGVAVCAGADGGETDAAHVALFGEFETGPITGLELAGFAMPAVVVDGADGVKYVLRGQGAGGGCDGATGRTSARFLADGVQLPHDGGSAHAMD